MFEVHTPWTDLTEIWIKLDWLTGRTKRMMSLLKVAKLESMFLSHLSCSFHFLFFGFWSKWPKSKKNQLSCLFNFCKKKYEFCLKWQLIFVFLSKWPKINWYMLIVTFLNKKCFELIKTRGNFQAWKFCEKYQDS